MLSHRGRTVRRASCPLGRASSPSAKCIRWIDAQPPYIVVIDRSAARARLRRLISTTAQLSPARKLHSILNRIRLSRRSLDGTLAKRRAHNLRKLVREANGMTALTRTGSPKMKNEVGDRRTQEPVRTVGGVFETPQLPASRSPNVTARALSVEAVMDLAAEILWPDSHE